MAELPRLIKHWNLYVDARTYAGKCTELEPPTIETKTEDYRAAGMDSPIKIDMGLEPLVCTWTMGELNADLLRQCGLLSLDGVSVTLHAGLDAESIIPTPVTITMRGKVTKWEPGTWKGEELNTNKFEFAAAYYRYEQNFQVIHEIDVMNMTRSVGGFDQMLAYKALIG